MSKLIQRIERLGKDTPAPMGFGVAARRQPQPTMVLLAAAADAKAAAALGETPVDGVLLRTGPRNVSAAAKTLSKSAIAPWGVEADTLSIDEMKTLGEAGADFVTLTSFASTLEPLHDAEVGRLLIVPADMKEEHAHSLEVMPIDAVVYAETVTAPLTLDALMQIATARCEIGRPFLLPVSGVLTAWEMECLREIGVEGVVADVESVGTEGLQALAQAIRDLPRRRPRNDAGSPLLPLTRPHVHHSHDDDDGEDDDFDPGDPDDLP